MSTHQDTELWRLLRDLDMGQFEDLISKPTSDMNDQIMVDMPTYSEVRVLIAASEV